METKPIKKKDFMQEVKDFFKPLTEKKGKKLKDAEDAVDKLKKRRGRPQMAKVTPTTIAGQYASTTELNNNFTLLADAIENTVSRDGTQSQDIPPDRHWNPRGWPTSPMNQR